jgi:hypothetical protein
MPSNADNLNAAKASLTGQLAAACAAAGPTYKKDGQMVDRIGFIKELQDQIDRINDLLAQECPFELRSEVL